MSMCLCDDYLYEYESKDVCCMWVCVCVCEYVCVRLPV
jgi:hypothetical protein